jgi:hypothetical protein
MERSPSRVLAVQMTKCWRRITSDRTERFIRQQSCPIRFKADPICFKSKKEGEKRAMARTNLGYLPTENPCAQCGKPIAAPEWIENGPHRTSYLWRCSACDYEFEAVAFFADSESTSEPLAA